MAKPARDLDPFKVSSPRIYLFRMLVFLVLGVLLVVVLHRQIWAAFLANPGLNGLIVGVLLIGVVLAFRQVVRLFPEVAWVNGFRLADPGLAVERPPSLLAPMASILGDRVGAVAISAPMLRSILDSIAMRLDEARDTSRYMTGLLVFLGLLGTFWGLIETVGSVGRVIDGLKVGGDAGAMFDSLKEGLAAPLGGMGISFSSSLFGLAGSLVLGFLELQASQAHNRFFQDVEDWLSGATRLSSGAGGSLETGDQSMPAYLTALLEQTAENLDSLQRTVATAEEGRRSANANLMALTERLSTLTDQMRAEQQLLLRLGESQLEMKGLLDRLSDAAIGGLDESSRQHLRNMDIYLARLVEESSSGRGQAVQEIRSEIKLLARTIAALAEESEQR